MKKTLFRLALIVCLVTNISVIKSMAQDSLKVGCFSSTTPTNGYTTSQLNNIIQYWLNNSSTVTNSTIVYLVSSNSFYLSSKVNSVLTYFNLNQESNGDLYFVAGVTCEHKCTSNGCTSCTITITTPCSTATCSCNGTGSCDVTIVVNGSMVFPTALKDYIASIGSANCNP